jgi:SAM-dependent methyltransferase
MSTHCFSTDDTFLRIRGGTWADLDWNKREAIIDQAFHYWRAHGFPYYRLTEKQIGQEFSRLKTKDWKAVFTVTGLRSSNAGLRLANAFQPGMWRAKVHRFRSPMDVFNDDRLLRRAIERALKIWPDRFGANASCLRRILKTFSDTASVSNYRPMVAKAVIAKYSKEGLVVDFSAGYGGRLLGALALNRGYVGIEPSRGQVVGFRRMIAALDRLEFSLPKVEILTGVAEKVLPRLATRSTELVFSSPPFFDWEQYSKSNSQSFRRFPDYTVWRSNFLEPVIRESHRILKRHGHLVLNVTNGNRLPSATHVREAAESVGFTLSTIHKMVFPKVPYLHPRNGEAVKTELLLVFRK